MTRVAHKIIDYTKWICRSWTRVALVINLAVIAGAVVYGALLK